MMISKLMFFDAGQNIVLFMVESLLEREFLDAVFK